MSTLCEARACSGAIARLRGNPHRRVRCPVGVIVATLDDLEKETFLERPQEQLEVLPVRLPRIQYVVLREPRGQLPVQIVAGLEIFVIIRRDGQNMRTPRA